MNQTELANALDAVYTERAHLVALIAAHHPAVWIEGDDWDYPIVYIELPVGQVSWHIKRDDLRLFGHIEHLPGYPWDGHDTDEKYQRIRQQTASLAKDRPIPPCPATFPPDGEALVTCVLDRHFHGNHKAPNGRAWWIDDNAPAAIASELG